MALLTPEQFMDGMMSRARSLVDTMPMDEVCEIAAAKPTGSLYEGVAFDFILWLAAKDRALENSLDQPGR